MQLKKANLMYSGRRWIAGILFLPVGIGALGCARESPSPPAVADRSPAATDRSARAPASPDDPKAAETERQVYAKKTAEPLAVAAPPGAVAEGSAQGGGRLNRERVPKVLLTASHTALCRVTVGDSLPALRLPDLEGAEQDLTELYGKRLTVVCFWSDDRALARAELADLGPDVVAPYQERGVAVVGIAVNSPPDRVRQLVTDGGISFPILVDADGAGFAQIGEKKLPRTYLLDHSGKVLWFDIEYSRSTRRELIEALDAMLGDR